MATPQPGILALGTRSHHHIEFDRRPDVTADAVVLALRGLREPAAAAGGANIVVGFGAALWGEMALPADVPTDLAPFEAIEGVEGNRAPATQHDLWVWIHGSGTDIVFDIARSIVGCLGGIADVAIDQRCFVYRDSRDLTGFVDGTANPPVHEAPGVAFIGEDAPGAGGSIVLTQRWVHDLDSFGALPTADQERVFGRTKPDSVELDDDAKPATAHIVRVEIEGDHGEELPIFRRSTPFGTIAEHGLYFVAFSAERGRFDRMLANMFGTSGDGLRDHLLDFSSPASGSYYFAPSLDSLDALLGPDS